MQPFGAMGSPSLHGEAQCWKRQGPSAVGTSPPSMMLSTRMVGPGRAEREVCHACPYTSHPPYRCFGLSCIVSPRTTQLWPELFRPPPRNGACLSGYIRSCVVPPQERVLEHESYLERSLPDTTRVSSFWAFQGVICRSPCTFEALSGMVRAGATTGVAAEVDRGMWTLASMETR